MSAHPKYIYKIIPHSSVDSRYTFPIPIPASHTFFLSELDYKSGYIHLSTPTQVPATLNRFFGDVPAVVILRMETERVGAWKKLTWDADERGEVFPHMHGHLEGENINSFKEVHRRTREGVNEKETIGWDKALDEQVKGWLI